MFETYAIIASLLVPTGLISLVHLLWNVQKNKPLLWTLILECIVTLLLGIVYTCCAIILSQTSVASEVTHFGNNNVDDMAIINDTLYTDFDITTFYNKIEPIPLEQTNEVEDSRNYKKKDPSEVLKNYQYLIQTKVDRQMLQNGTNQEATRYQRMLYSARNMEQPLKMDSLENADCFLRFFFYRSLLVYSFVTCALSLLNTGHLCKQYLINEKSSATEPKTDNPSEQFGEKVLDNSSHNAVPVGPLFDDKDSLTTPNLDVFNVKLKAQHNITESSRLKEKKEGNIFTVGICAIMLTLPAVFVAILYILMRSGYTSHLPPPPPDKVTVDLWYSFNITPSDPATIKTVLTDENVNGTYQKDMESVLRQVYAVINKFQDEHNQSTNRLPTIIRGQYLLYPLNGTEDCPDNKTNLKTFDFLVFVVLFFAVIFYSKVSDRQMSTNTSTRILNRSTLAFAILWAPQILDMVVSMFITNREPRVISSLLLLVGNINRLYSSIQNVCTMKRYRNSSGSIKPAC